ncbi:MAG: hypothetical protein D6748_03455 [Calditrichaeota bacterium]|nr:MAG: hypothetical protein D6748_03455 [Calditrichota bacterium]
MSDSLMYGLNLTFVGLMIVFVVLAGIASLIAFLRWLDKQGLEREQAQKEAALEKDQTIDETTLVLIAAAVATVLRGRYHIRSVKRIIPGGGKTSPWSIQGRAVLHGSHVIHKKS